MAFQAKARPVPSSFIRYIIFCPFVGVPVGAPNVGAVARAVIV